MGVLSNTVGKLITIMVCIFVWIVSGIWYENIRGTLEGVMVAGQVEDDSVTYLVSKLMSEGLIISTVHWILSLIILIMVIKIIATIYTNGAVLKTAKGPWGVLRDFLTKK